MTRRTAQHSETNTATPVARENFAAKRKAAPKRRQTSNKIPSSSKKCKTMHAYRSSRNHKKYESDSDYDEDEKTEEEEDEEVEEEDEEN